MSWLLLLPVWLCLLVPPGAPDLDHTNPHLREALVHWMQHLRDNVGFRGWRFDFAKVGGQRGPDSSAGRWWCGGTKKR